jgi:DNA (cytosine-5)-methyltransferase 1
VRTETHRINGEGYRVVYAGEVDFTRVEPVDLLAGGFPCQDVSLAGKGAGLSGERSGLWREFRRAVGEIRPRYVLVENTPSLSGRGFGVILGDLAALGYDAEWESVPAAAFGAAHLRWRVFIIARYVADAHRFRRAQTKGLSSSPRERRVFAQHMLPDPLALSTSHWAADQPELVRVAHGAPKALDFARRRGIGNSVVPHVAQWLGELILAHDNARAA